MTRIISLFTIVIIAVSCNGDPEPSTTEARFRLLYNGDPLVMFDEMSYPDGKSMFFTRVSFFVEDVKLIGDETILLSARDYISLTESHLSLAEAESGFLFYTGDISPGNYKLDFNIGVSQPLNDMVPADFPSSDVLSDAAEYWPGWESYVFAKIEGKIDLDGDQEEETGFAMHIGGNDALRQITTTDYTIEGSHSELMLNINLEKFFGIGNQLHDIANTPQIHSPEQNPIVKILADNLVTCFN